MMLPSMHLRLLSVIAYLASPLAVGRVISLDADSQAKANRWLRRFVILFFSNLMAFSGVAKAVTISAQVPWSKPQVTASLPYHPLMTSVLFMGSGSTARCYVYDNWVYGNMPTKFNAPSVTTAYCTGGEENKSNYTIYGANCSLNPTGTSDSNWYKDYFCQDLLVMAQDEVLHTGVSVTIPSTSIELPTDGSTRLLIGDIVTTGEQGYFQSGVTITGDSELTGENTGKKIPLVFKDKNGSVITRSGTSLNAGPNTTISANFEGAAGDRYVANLVVTVTIF